MEPASKLQIIGVMAAVLILLIIGVTKEDFPLWSQSIEETVVETSPEKTLEEYQPELATPMYYLVVGSFMDESNAEDYYYELGELGYTTYSLPRTDGFIRIGVFASPYKEDVIEYQNTIFKDLPKSWITYQ